MRIQQSKLHDALVWCLGHSSTLGAVMRIMMKVTSSYLRVVSAAGREKQDRSHMFKALRKLQ